ncbi:hypothetical protein D9613_001306 [Agrocybe pediades]|uniref:Uncharacterized protein n=1 Tax=Agrocybe pediades TaxID=84607 RepID=A0A8H4VX76_9AGAR|nr:hypothetical protein D9613_001306 [Agrocybe pediades]KAF9560663.1 hypothetical protein CPC08DRAFT_818135 [Agrocybe pediades]
MMLPHKLFLSLVPGIYEIHSSDIHYATGYGTGSLITALPLLKGAGPVTQKWQVEVVLKDGEVVHTIAKPGSIAGEAGGFYVKEARNSADVEYQAELSHWHLMPVPDQNSTYVIVPSKELIGARLAIAVGQRANSEPTLVLDSFPLHGSNPLPGWVFTAVNV